MSRERKTVTDNPIVDELVYNGQQLIYGIVLKDQEEADNNETMESIKQSDIYMAIKENRLSFSSFTYTRRILSVIEEFTEDEIKYYALNNSDIPEEYRDKLLAYAEELFIDNYEEQNNYYRKLNGLPDYEDGGLYITPNMVDGISGDIWKSIKSVKNIPIHEWDVMYLNILDSSGYLDSIKEEYSDLKYLNYLGSNKIDIYTSRKAQKFECIYLPTCDSTSVRNRFLELLDKNRSLFLKTTYIEAYKFSSDYFDKFIIIMIILQSFNDLIAEAPKYIIQRDFWEYRMIQYLFEANGLKYFREIPIKYQLNFVSNMNRLIKYKSTDQNIIDICSLFGFENMKLFKYYIMKDRTLSNDDYKYIATLTNAWTPSALPEIKNWYGVDYVNSYYVALGAKILAYSSGGTNWKEIPISSYSNREYSWSKIVYGNSIYVAINTDQVSDVTNIEIAIGSDIKKLSLTKLNIVSTNFVKQKTTCKDIIFANGMFYILTDDFIITTVSGKAWQLTKCEHLDSNGKSETLKSLLYRNDTFYLVTENSILKGSDISSITTKVGSDEFLSSYSWKKLYNYDGKLYVITDSSKKQKLFVLIDENKLTWKEISLPEDRLWGEFLYGNGIYVLIPYCETTGANSVNAYYSDDNCETWNILPFHKESYWSAGCYGNKKFIGIAGKFYPSNAMAYFVYTTENVDDTSTDIYNNTSNYALKFIKTEIDGNVIDALADPTSIYDYYTIIDQDEFWEGDYERKEVVQNILNHNFNILRTKYYSIENITDLTEMTFELSYFMNIIMNTDGLCDALTVQLPFISSGSFRLVDCFVLLYALGYEYYGVTDNIMNTGSNVLTIRAFNFESDLTKLQNDLAEQGYSLYDLCGDADFIIPDSIGTYKQLMYIYENNKSIYSHITEQMLKAQNKDIYDIYKKIYEALFIAKLNMANFSAKDADGNILYTYSTFTAYLAANDVVLYNYLLGVKSISNDEDKIETITSAMNDITSYIEEYTNLDELPNIEYLWSGLPTLSMDFVKNYIYKMINFFKSFKAHILSVSTIYKLCDKFDNTMFWIDKVHFNYKFDKAEIIHIYESIMSDVSFTYKDKVEIMDMMDMVISKLIQFAFQENFKIDDKYILNTIIEKKDKFDIDQKLYQWIVSQIKDEEVYIKDNFYKSDIYTYEDKFGIASKVKIRITGEDNYKSRSVIYEN